VLEKVKRVIAGIKRTRVLYNVNNAPGNLKRCLFIYLTEPFVVPASHPGFYRHQNFKQCKQIAKVIGECGYIVDVADCSTPEVHSKKKYALIISHNLNTKTGGALDKNGKKLYFSTGSNPAFMRSNLNRRNRQLFERKGTELPILIFNDKVMSFVSSADAIVGFGNDFTKSTWRSDFEGPIYTFNNYGFENIRCSGDRDFRTAKKNFLFFTSGPQVLKGLDLLLDTFPAMPDLHLFVCSHFENEKQFCDVYKKELYRTPNIHPVGFIKIGSDRFYELCRTCAWVILPSCSEASAGSVVQCMYAGLVPIVTREAGIDLEDFGVLIGDDTLKEIRDVLINVSCQEDDTVRRLSGRTRIAAETKYSENHFCNSWRSIISKIIS